MELRFPLGAVRPLPAPAGSVLLWAGNTLHYGTACGPRGGAADAGAPPRQPLAMTFRRPAAGAGCFSGHLRPLSRAAAAALGPRERLALIAHSLLLYKKWFKQWLEAYRAFYEEQVLRARGGSGAGGGTTTSNVMRDQ